MRSVAALLAAISSKTAPMRASRSLPPRRCRLWRGLKSALLLGDILDRLFLLTGRSPRAANLGRRPAVDFGKDGVEPSQAPEARPHRDLGHRQAGLVEEAFGSLNACGPCHF